MRALLFMLLFVSHAFAEDDFQKKLAELQEKREETLYQWRTQNRFNETTLAPFSKLAAYREFRQKLETDHLASEIKLHADACAATKKNCLTPLEEQNKRLAMMGKLADLAKRTSTQMENVPQVAARELVVPQERREVAATVPETQRPATQKPEFRPDIGPRPQRVEEVKEVRRTVESTQSVTLEAKTVEVSVTPQVTTPEVKPAEVVVAKPEVKPEVTPEVKPEAKPEVAVVTPEVKPEVQPETKPAEVKPVVPSVNEDEKSPKNYKAETCKWVNDLPRKIVVGPGCGGKSKSRICTGYVVCEQKVGGGKFVRQSTCAADKCGENDAVACTRDQYYFSSKPSDEEKQFVSPKLKEILSSEQ